MWIIHVVPRFNTLIWEQQEKETIRPKLSKRKTISFEHKHNVTAVNVFDFSINWYANYLIRHY